MSSPSTTGRLLKDCKEGDAVYQAGDWRTQRAVFKPELLILDFVLGIVFEKLLVGII